MRSFVIKVLSLCVASALTISASAAFTTGFESPDYTTTGLHGQQGWSVSGAGGTADVQVSTANPQTGLQHARMLGVGTQAGLTPTGFTSPLAGNSALNASLASFDVNISGVTQSSDPNLAGATYIFLINESASVTTTEIDFNFDGSILVDAGGASLTDTGVDWLPNTDYTVSVLVDPNGAADRKLIFSLNGSEILASEFIPGLGTVANQFQFFSDNFQQATEVADFDNINLSAVVPEPGSLAFLASGLLVLRRRK